MLKFAHTFGSVSSTSALHVPLPRVSFDFTCFNPSTSPNDTYIQLATRKPRSDYRNYTQIQPSDAPLRVPQATMAGTKPTPIQPGGDQEVILPGANKVQKVVFDFNKTFKIVAGKDENTAEYIVHESAVSGSAFFKAALREEWAEGKDRVVHFPEDPPPIVWLYLFLLYMKKNPAHRG